MEMKLDLGGLAAAELSELNGLLRERIESCTSVAAAVAPGNPYWSSVRITRRLACPSS